MPSVKLPDGTSALFPEGMPPAEIEAVIHKQFPPAKAEPEKPKTQWPNLRTVKPEEAQTFPSPSEYIGGNLKRNAPDIAAMTAMGLIPGSGFLPTIGRTAAAAGAGGGAAAATGQPVKETMAREAAGSLAGHLLGGIGGAVSKVAKSAWDRTAAKVAESLTSIIPEFGAKTPEGTISKILSGEALRAVGERYDKGIKALFGKHGDPDILVPSLGRVLGDEQAGGRASEIRQRIKKGLSRAFDAGDGERITIYRQAEDEFEHALSKAWGVDAGVALREIGKDYRKAKTISDWITQGKGRISQAQLDALAPAEGKGLNVPTLQGLFQTARGSLKSALSPEEYQSILQSLRLNEESLGRDVPGKGLSIGSHVSPYGVSGYVRHLPKAPSMTGEEVSPELVGSALRALGTEAVAGGLKPTTKGDN